jgi:hypothetical protein
VESCTALAEDESGRIHLIRWQEPVAAQTAAPAIPAPAPALALPAMLSGAPAPEPAEIVINSPPRELGQSFASGERLGRRGAAFSPQGALVQEWTGDGRVD